MQPQILCSNEYKNISDNNRNNIELKLRAYKVLVIQCIAT